MGSGGPISKAIAVKERKMQMRVIGNGSQVKKGNFTATIFNSESSKVAGVANGYGT